MATNRVLTTRQMGGIRHIYIEVFGTTTTESITLPANTQPIAVHKTHLQNTSNVPTHTLRVDTGALALAALEAAATVVSATTAGSPVVTSAALFTAAMVGKAISGTGIPDFTYIVSLTDTSTIGISKSATVTGAPTLTLGTHLMVIVETL